MEPDRPMIETYWVIPGRLLAGPYPGARYEAAAQQRIRRFLDAGITLFLDLTEEGEAAPYAQWLGGAARHRRMPIPDFGVPLPEQMARTLDLIDMAIKTPGAIYVHCLGGLGRSGAVVSCYLVRHGMSGEEALATIRRLRKDTPFSTSPSPETEAQRQMVLAWRQGQ